jgi:general stress protein 26
MKNGLKDFSSPDVKVIGEIIQDLKVGMVTTLNEEGGLCSRPMWVQEADSTGTLWFFTSRNSELMREIRENPHVNVTFSSPEKNKYLSTSGLGYEVYDQSKMQELWDPSLKAWYKEGLETPGIVLLKIEMRDTEYWDAPGSVVVRIVGFVKSMVSDEQYKPARHERVNLQH